MAVVNFTSQHIRILGWGGRKKKKKMQLHGCDRENKARKGQGWGLAAVRDDAVLIGGVLRGSTQYGGRLLRVV